MNRCLFSIVTYLLTFVFGLLASKLALPIFGELASYPLLRGLFAGVMTLGTAIFLVSGAIRVICGNKFALGFSTPKTLDENKRGEERTLNS